MTPFVISPISIQLLRAARSLLTSPADHVSPFLNSIFNSVLKKGENEIILFETDGKAPGEITLTDEPDIG